MSEPSASATWSGPGKGEQLWFLGTLAIIRAAGEASDGRFALIEFLFPRNASPPLHTHPQDESYIVQEGRLTVQAGEQRFEFRALRGADFDLNATPDALPAKFHRAVPTVSSGPIDFFVDLPTVGKAQQMKDLKPQVRTNAQAAAAYVAAESALPALYCAYFAGSTAPTCR